ncbi:hypothetical protein DICA3_E19944 [Diutina catenulata]
MSTISEPVEVEKKTTPDDVDIDDTNARYAAYLNRIRTIMRASHRYVAYSSDVGESFRPVAHPGMIKAAYALSFGYVGASVAYDAWKVGLAAEGKYRPGLMPWQPTPPADPKAKAQFLETHPKRYENDWRVAAVKGAIFQLVASMALPAFTIHSTVRYSSVLFKNASNPKIKTWGPVALGLAVVPALPYIFDEPVEHVVDWAFDELEKFY